MNCVGSRQRIPAVRTATALAVAVLWATPWVGAVPQRAGSDSRDRHVFLTVLDRNDAPVTDLTPADVVVKEDGAVREIVSVARATMPLQIVLLVDDSQAAQALTNRLRESTTAFVHRLAQSNPETAISIWTFGDRPTKVLDFTTSEPVITRATGALVSRPGSGAYLMEALVNVSAQLGTLASQRPAIVAFLVEDSPEFSTVTERTVAAALQTAGAALWTIVLQGHGAGTADAEGHERARVVADDATASGGGSKVILDGLALESAFASIASRLASQMDVTYARPDRLVPPKKLDVTVTRPGVRVLAPRWAGR